MIFEAKDDKLKTLTGTWDVPELKLEELIVSLVDKKENRVLYDILGEDLFYINKQIYTNTKKKADLLFIDKNGDAVIVELKKDEGRLGVETQALQYLSDFSNYQGNEFIKKYCKGIDKETIKAFIDDDVDIDSINANSRIILVARHFDPTLFSMGKWFAESNISFRCVSYTPLEIEGKKLISFSVVFDQLSKSTKYKIQFKEKSRKPSVFWHVIGDFDEKWWNYLIDNNQISASFTNEPGDKGEYVLKKYIKGDTILAYASKIGLIGIGEIGENPKYELIKKDSSDDFLKGLHRHRLSCNWQYVLKKLGDSVSAKELKDYKIHHPFQTSSEIRTGDVDRLTEHFKSKEGVIKLK